MQQNTFGERLTELRENKNLSRQKVADDLGVSRASLEYYEKGKRTPDIEILLKLADYFGVTCDYLIKGVSTENVSIHAKTGLSDKAIKVLSLLNSKKDKAIEYRDFIDVFIKNKNIECENGCFVYCGYICEFNYDKVYLIDAVNYFIEKIYERYLDLNGLMRIANLKYTDSEFNKSLSEIIIDTDINLYKRIYNQGTILMGKEYSEYLEQIVINNFSDWLDDFMQKFSSCKPIATNIYSDEKGLHMATTDEIFLKKYGSLEDDVKRFFEKVDDVKFKLTSLKDGEE